MLRYRPATTEAALQGIFLEAGEVLRSSIVRVWRAGTKLYDQAPKGS